ncbi:MAG: efflux RND transporter periplasmic adaptor subunit [Candidatus Krumholzibacteria bacterium]|nr:efflux RND transporter periplasmic adaptor subunit [Candidatus Krumholzibacteria bacterium]
MRRRVLIVAGAVVLALIGYRITVLLTRNSESGQRDSGRPPVAVEVSPVSFGPIQELRQFTGTVFPYNQYVVAPKVSGRLLMIRKRIGDPVRRGELIAQIDDAEYQQAVREAEANLRIAQASFAEARSQADLARQEKERLESLRAKDLVTDSEFESAATHYEAQQSRLALAEAQVEQREASLASARIRLGYTRLSASRPGFIGERFVDEGALLAANAAVVLVVGIDSVIVRTTITERDYGFIDRGQPVDVVVDAFAGRRFRGSVARVAPMMREASRMAEMEVEVDNSDHFLKPGMFARVEVMTASRDSTQLVPSAAVVDRDTGPVVFVVPDGATKVSRVSVTTGIVTPSMTEIVEPPLSGRVVTLGQHLLEDGSPVLLPGSEQAPAGGGGRKTTG